MGCMISGWHQCQAPPGDGSSCHHIYEGHSPVVLFERHLISHLNPMLDERHLSRSRSLWENRRSHLGSSSPACLCLFSGQSSWPWRCNSSRIQPFWESLAGLPEVSLGRVTSGTWLAGVTFPSMTLARTTKG